MAISPLAGGLGDVRPKLGGMLPRAAGRRQEGADKGRRARAGARVTRPRRAIPRAALAAACARARVAAHGTLSRGQPGPGGGYRLSAGTAGRARPRPGTGGPPVARGSGTAGGGCPRWRAWPANGGRLPGHERRWPGEGVLHAQQLAEEPVELHQHLPRVDPTAGRVPDQGIHREIPAEAADTMPSAYQPPRPRPSPCRAKRARRAVRVSASSGRLSSRTRVMRANRRANPEG